jgi:hypothetical protein
MNSERLRMVTERSHVGELFGFAMLGIAAIVWPLVLLADSLGAIQ